MKTTDLRIGNLVSYKNEDIVVVDAVSKDFILTHGQFKISTPNIEPISLTEQWLVDFGFEKYTGRYGVYYKHYALEGFRVWLPRDIYGWGYTVGRKDFETGDTYWVKNEVRYVHQLQNLYFALTQEELILKERGKE